MATSTTSTAKLSQVYPCTSSLGMLQRYLPPRHMIHKMISSSGSGKTMGKFLLKVKKAKRNAVNNGR